MRFSTVKSFTVAFRALLTVGALTPISAAIARSDFSGFAAIASRRRGNGPPRRWPGLAAPTSGRGAQTRPRAS
jgi:hypothetical protein